MSKSLNVAIVGLGYGVTRCEMLLRTPGVRLTAVVDSNRERARLASERFNVPWFSNHRQMLDTADVELVGIYTPSGAHREVAIDAAITGRHVLLTKPIEVSVRRADEIIDACGSAGVRAFCEFHSRYDAASFRLHEAIKAGKLGRLVMGEFSAKCYRPEEYFQHGGNWRATWELNGGGVVMNQAAHAIDKLLWCMGPVATVSAITSNQSEVREVEDSAAAVLRMQSGAICVLTGTSTFRTPHGMDDMYGGGFTMRCEVHGDQGSVTVRDSEISTVQLESGELGQYPGCPPNVFADIHRTLRERDYLSPTLASGDDGREVVRVASAIYKSARSGAEVEVDTTTSSDRMKH